MSGDLRDACLCRIGTPQRGASLVQALQQEISRGAYAEKLGATHSQRSLCNANLRAKLGHVEFPINALAQRFFEANHDGGAMVSRPGMVVSLLGGQAMDDGAEHFLLQRSCGLGALDQFLASFREMAGLPEQALESCSFRARRTEYPARRRWRDRPPGQCLAAAAELFRCQRYRTPPTLTVGVLMQALAAVMKNHVATSQSKSAACKRCSADWKGKENPFGEERNIGNTGKAFGILINFQMLQFQPCQPSLEISSGTKLSSTKGA